jgi:hypothetical protein
MVKKSLFAVLFVVAVSFASPMKYVGEMMKLDIRANSKELVALNIEFADSTIEKAFWFEYSSFDELNKKYLDSYGKLLKKYSDSYDSLTAESADALVTGMFGLQKVRRDNLRKSYKKIKKSSGAIVAMKFIQIQNRIDLMLDLEIAEVVPVITQK